MLAILVAVLLSTAPHYDPRNVLVEHCIATGDRVDCLLERIDHGALQLLATHETQSALALSPVGTLIAAQEQRTVSEHRYYAMRDDVLGTYVYDQDASGLPQITAVGFPAWFTPLANARDIIAHQPTDPLAADPRLASGGFAHRCLAGVFGDMLAGAGAGVIGGIKAAQELVPNNPAAPLGGAIIGGIAGAITGVIKGYADYCEDPANAATPDCKPAPACDPSVTTCKEGMPTPDAAPDTGITNPQPRQDPPSAPANTLTNPHGEHVTQPRDRPAPPSPTAALGKRIIPNDEHGTAAPKPVPAPARMGTLVNPGSGPVTRAPRGDK